MDLLLYEKLRIRSLSELELALYRDLIAILDYYPRLEEQNKKLYQEIAACIERNKDYEDLVQAMVQL